MDQSIFLFDQNLAYEKYYLHGLNKYFGGNNHNHLQQ